MLCGGRNWARAAARRSRPDRRPAVKRPHRPASLAPVRQIRHPGYGASSAKTTARSETVSGPDTLNPPIHRGVRMPSDRLSPVGTTDVFGKRSIRIGSAEFRMHSFVSCPLVLNQGTSAVFRSAAPSRGFWLLQDGAHPLRKQWAILGCPSRDGILRRMICTRAMESLGEED